MSSPYHLLYPSDRWPLVRGERAGGAELAEETKVSGVGGVREKSTWADMGEKMFKKSIAYGGKNVQEIDCEWSRILSSSLFASTFENMPFQNVQNAENGKFRACIWRQTLSIEIQFPSFERAEKRSINRS